MNEKFNKIEIKTTFQSRFSLQEWLKPYTDKTLEELKKGVKNLLIICPGFASDCVETLEEINIAGRKFYKTEEKTLILYHVLMIPLNI